MVYFFYIILYITIKIVNSDVSINSSVVRRKIKLCFLLPKPLKSHYRESCSAENVPFLWGFVTWVGASLKPWRDF